MALDIFSENPSTPTTTTPATPTMAMSPRISFSYDLSQSDIVPVEQLLRSISSSSSSSDFNFCVHENNFHRHSNSLADEIFSDGKILPTQVRTAAEKSVRESPDDPPPPPPPESTSDQTESSAKQNSKSFWGFKRSSSCGSGYARSLCPLPLLSRSNSTGSSTSSKRSAKEALIPKQKPSQPPQKPPLRKASGSYGNGNGGGGVRVNPVLHVPSANMFGLGSFFLGSKDRNKKKSFH